MFFDSFSGRISREWKVLKEKCRAIFWIACLVALIGLGVIFSSLGSDSYYGCSWLPFPMHTPVFFCFTWLAVHFLQGIVIAAPLTEVPLLEKGLSRRVFCLGIAAYLFSLGWFLRFFKTPSMVMTFFLLLTAAFFSGRIIWRVARRSFLVTLLEAPVFVWLLCNLVATEKMVITEHL